MAYFLHSMGKFGLCFRFFMLGTFHIVSHRNIRKNQGFTLIEVLITIAILAIIATMAVPTMQQMIASQNLNKSTQTLVATLRDARAKAVLERKTVTVKLNSVAIDSATQMNWAPYGKATLKSTKTEVSFLMTGGIKDATGDTDIKICESSVTGSRAKTIKISQIGSVQRIIEGTC